MNEQENMISNEIPTESPVASVVEPKPENSITKAVKNQKFLAICILYSIFFALPFLSSLSGGFSLNIIGLLFTIGLWMVYANGQKTLVTDPLSFTAPNLLSGTVKACRIIVLVLSILSMVIGVLCGICVPILNTAPDLKESFVAEFQAIQLTVGGNVFRFADKPELAIAILIGCAIGFIIAGILLLVLHYCFFYRYLHRLTYSVCENIKNGTEIDYTPALRKWLMVLGILTAITAAVSGTMLAMIANGCSAASMIVASVWLKEQFEKK